MRRYFGSLSMVVFGIMMGCGDGGTTTGAGGAGGTGAAGASAGVAGAGGGAGGAGTSAAGGAGTSTAGGAGTSGGGAGSGGAASGGAGAGVGSVAACQIPKAWASCTSALTNGVGSCTEIDQASGAFQSVCPAAEFHMGQNCPGQPDLYGVCVAGITTYYYSPPGAPQWTQLGRLCPASGGKWCQVQ